MITVVWVYVSVLIFKSIYIYIYVYVCMFVCVHRISVDVRLYVGVGEWVAVHVLVNAC